MNNFKITSNPDCINLFFFLKNVIVNFITSIKGVDINENQSRLQIFTFLL